MAVNVIMGAHSIIDNAENAEKTSFISTHKWLILEYLDQYAEYKSSITRKIETKPIFGSPMALFLHTVVN